MTNLQWTLIEASPGSARPSPRWGHSCCVVNENLYIFGGFADSNYMNDLWTYNLKSLAWSQIVALGDIPQPRSNASISYDSVNHQLILFGGGGSNRQRFNSVSVFDLTNFHWVQFPPFENQPSPWQRTYHTAEFKFPYLVIFGGEGLEDLGDLWAYNMETLSWKEIKVSESSIQPKARRFHSSCIIQNSIYIFGGCEVKYSCLKDFFKLDLSSFIETGDTSRLKWQEIKLYGDEAVARWGHTSHCYNGQIYVFGGRGNQDLQDLFSINPQTGKVRQVKGVSPPQSRRRHSGGFVGGCLVIFGGFNGNYFNDLKYINIYRNKHNKNSSNQSFQAILYPDYDIFSFNKLKMSINTALIGKYFEDKQDMLEFLNAINNFYLIEELQVAFQTLYKGYGKFPIQKVHRNMMKLHPSQTYPTNKEILEEINLNNYEKRMFRPEGRALQLEPFQLEIYIKSIQQNWQSNQFIKLNNNEILKFNKQLLCQTSKFFDFLLSNNYKTQVFTPINLKNCTVIHLSLIFAFLHSKFLVIPKSFSYQFLMQMVQLAQYFIIPSLSRACQDELSLRIVSTNCQELSWISKQFRLNYLSQKCSLFILNEKIMNGQKQKCCLLSQSEEKKLDAQTLKLYKEIQFDLAHFKPQSKYTKSSKNGMEFQQKSYIFNKENQPMNCLPRKTSNHYQK